MSSGVASERVGRENPVHHPLEQDGNRGSDRIASKSGSWAKMVVRSKPPSTEAPQLGECLVGELATPAPFAIGQLASGLPRPTAGTSRASEQAAS